MLVEVAYKIVAIFLHSRLLLIQEGLDVGSGTVGSSWEIWSTTQAY